MTRTVSDMTKQDAINLFMELVDELFPGESEIFSEIFCEWRYLTTMHDCVIFRTDCNEEVRVASVLVRNPDFDFHCSCGRKVRLST